MISYKLLADAGDFYASAGYRPVAAPWVVSKEVMDITAPEWAACYPLADEGLLVASGEQSFLQLLTNGKLAPGKWQCTTPCFRGDELAELHHRYFMKLELISTRSTTKSELSRAVNLCNRFFKSYLPCNVVPTSRSEDIAGYDIVTDGGIELGSYGIREHPKVGRWLYATGCAEPRLTQAISHEIR